LVTHQCHQDPLSGYLFVFTNRRKNRIKLLFFDGSGVWVCAKRLMGSGCFAWPKTDDPGALQIVAEELTLLLTGDRFGEDERPSVVAQGGMIFWQKGGKLIDIITYYHYKTRELNDFTRLAVRRSPPSL
jgi:hypothetical protein